MATPQKVFRIGISTLGCKVNQCDTAAIAKDFEEQGCEIVPFNAPADIYIINTCTVTAYADAQARQLIRRANRANPAARIVVTGCLAQTRPDDIALLDAVSLVIGNDQKHNLFNILNHSDPSSARIVAGDRLSQNRFLAAPACRISGRTRAFFKIQDGCDSFCSYCIVPFARGRSRSLEPDAVLKGACEFEQAGFQEIVLTGIHLGRYGHDFFPRRDLPDLLKALLPQHPNVRFRLSSIEPNEISDDLIGLFSHYANLCPHLHIPLQSGDGNILGRMKRTYSPSDYRLVVEKVTAAVPDVAVGVDVMVGFPGEDERAFYNTLSLLEELPVAYLHVFPYSERLGTEAVSLKPKVSDKIKKERAAVLRKLSDQKREAFSRRFIGGILPVLMEQTKDKKTGLSRGFSHNYLPVVLDCFQAFRGNRIVDVRIQHYEAGKLFGSRGNG